MLGVGIDISEVDRIRKITNRFGKRFLDRIYTPGELEYCSISGSGRYRFTSLAARFAAKEAFYKAAFPLLRHAILWHACEVINDTDGVPQMKIAENILKELHSQKIHVSLSHSDRYAVAIVMIE